MGGIKNALSWAGIVILGLLNGVLEDLLFVVLVVPNWPASWDLTGDIFWWFTVPFAQLMALVVTGTLAWFLGLRDLKKLATFWLCWTLARTAFLNFANNPVGDILIYLLWIALWCGLIALAVHFSNGRRADAG